MDRIPDLSTIPPHRRDWSLALLLPLALLLVSCGNLPEKAPQGQAAEVVVRPYPGLALTPDILYDILAGEVARQRGRYDVSLDAFMRLAVTTRDPRLIERATQAAVYAKRWEEAVTAARLWVEVESERATPWEVLGGLLLRVGKPAEAQLQFEKALTFYGSNLGNGYRRLADMLGRQSDRAAAAELMETLVKLHPDRPEAYFTLAQLAGRAQLPDKALVAATQALVLRPDWEEAALLKAHLLVSGKDVKRVDKFCESFLERHPQAKRLRLYYARYLLDNNQHDRARGHFKIIAEQDPEDADASFAVGLLAIQAKRFAEAEKYLKLTLGTSPRNDQARLYLGQLAVEREQYGKAAEWYRAIEEGKYYFEAQLRLAGVTAKDGMVDRALDQLHGIALSTQKQKVQRLLAEEQILREAKRLSAAMETLNKALVEIPDEKELLYARALLAAQMDMLDQHERDIRKLLAKDPTNAHALNALGYTLADQTDRHQEALELIEKALALKPEDPFILDSMGWAQYRVGNYQSAIDYLKRAMDKRPDAEIAAHLGEVLWIAGDRSGARSIWRQGLELAPENDVLRNTLKRFQQ